jgi:hypothetical protein
MHLWAQPPAFAVWTINLLSDMRRREERTRPLAADRAGDAQETPRATQPLLCASPCGHRFCEACFWRISVLAAGPLDELACPISECRAELRLDHESHAQSAAQPLRATPEEVAEQSRQRFSALPVLPSPDRPAKPKFQALPRAGLAALFVGTCQTQRVAELHKAALNGYIIFFL